VTDSPPPTAATSAATWRVLAATAYDGLLVLSLLLVVTGALHVLTHGEAISRDRVGAWQYAYASLQLAVIAAYFGVPWTRRGQTLAMKAWRLRLEAIDGSLPGWGAALRRLAVALPLYVLAVAGGLDLVVREPLPADFRDVPGQLRAGNPLRKAEALDAGQLLLQMQAVSKGPPGLAIKGLRGIKKRRAALQDVGAGSEPGLHIEPNLVADKIELDLRVPFHIRLAEKRGDHRDDQPGGERAQSAPPVARVATVQPMDHAGAPR